MSKLKIGQLKANPQNPRKISETAQKGLAKSIGLFGDISGIVFNKRTNQLVCGHQRLDQLKKQYGEENLKIDFVNKDGQEERHEIKTPSGDKFSVRVVDWDELKEKEANITANNQHISGEFDMDLLLPMLDEIKLNDSQTYFEVMLDGVENDIQINPNQEVSLNKIEFKNMKPYKKTHVLLSFDPNLFPDIKKHLDEILKINGVEYEQSSN